MTLLLAIEGPGFIDLATWLETKGVMGEHVLAGLALLAGVALVTWLWLRDKGRGF